MSTSSSHYTQADVRKFSEAEPHNKELKKFLKDLEELEQGKALKHVVDGILGQIHCYTPDCYRLVLDDGEYCDRCRARLEEDKKKKELAVTKTNEWKALLETLSKDYEVTLVCANINEVGSARGLTVVLPEVGKVELYEDTYRSGGRVSSSHYKRSVFIRPHTIGSKTINVLKPLDDPKIAVSVTKRLNTYFENLKSELALKKRRAKEQEETIQNIVNAFPTAVDIYKARNDSYYSRGSSRSRSDNSYTFKVGSQSLKTWDGLKFYMSVTYTGDADTINQIMKDHSK
jgi:hypothetical protein